MEARDDKERLQKKVAVGKRMCDTAEDILKVSEIEKYCDVLKIAIKTWRKHEALAKEAAYEDIMSAGNELYKLLDHAVRHYNLSEEDKRKATQCMSLWFDSLTHDESLRLSAYVASVPYDFE